jgi:hypothetical protein
MRWRGGSMKLSPTLRRDGGPEDGQAERGGGVSGRQSDARDEAGAEEEERAGGTGEARRFDAQDGAVFIQAILPPVNEAFVSQ